MSIPEQLGRRLTPVPCPIYQISDPFQIVVTQVSPSGARMILESNCREERISAPESMRQTISVNPFFLYPPLSSPPPLYEPRSCPLAPETPAPNVYAQVPSPEPTLILLPGRFEDFESSSSPLPPAASPTSPPALPFSLLTKACEFEYLCVTALIVLLAFGGIIWHFSKKNWS